MNEDFSIVIPTLNSEKFLGKTLESIKKQNKSIKIECIFSDGGSSDDTLSIINNFNQTNISKIILYNHGTEKFIVKNSDRIAQMVLMPALKFDFEEVSELSNTIRGSGGFGSTGK